jgi:hypothetical protein
MADPRHRRGRCQIVRFAGFDGEGVDRAVEPVALRATNLGALKRPVAGAEGVPRLYLRGEAASLPSVAAHVFRAVQELGLAIHDELLAVAVRTHQVQRRAALNRYMELQGTTGWTV